MNFTKQVLLWILKSNIDVVENKIDEVRFSCGLRFDFCHMIFKYQKRFYRVEYFTVDDRDPWHNLEDIDLIYAQQVVPVEKRIIEWGVLQ